jgi:hypothetical protein
LDQLTHHHLLPVRIIAVKPNEGLFPHQIHSNKNKIVRRIFGKFSMNIPVVALSATVLKQ